MSELPKGWVKTDFGFFARKSQYGYTAKASKQKTNTKFLRITDINNGQVNWDDVPFCTITDKELENYSLKKNDLLFARSGSVGVSYLVNENMPNVVFASYLIRLETSNELDFKFIRYFLDSQEYWSQIYNLSSGIGRLNINAENLKKIQMPLAPLAEQKRIVEKIEALFSRLDAGIAALEKTLSLSDKYIASVLKYAYGDFITKTDSVKYEELSLHVEQFQNGLAKRTGKEGSEHVVLRLADIKDYMFTKEKSRLIVLTDKEIEKYALNTNDLVFIRVNGSPDLVAKIILANGSEGFAFCDHFIRAKLKSSLLSEYLMYFGRTQDYRDYIKFNMVSTAGQHTISQTPLGSLKVPITSKEMQREVINFIEEKLSLIEKQKYEIYAQLKKAQALKSKILEYAFTGKLVPQNPDDEPAEVLLERIKAEKEASKPTKKTRKRK